ncbi:hypothetical protein ACN2GQ_004981, partial [Klebsiella oxytoca]
MRSIASGKLCHAALCSPGAALNAPCPGYRFITVCGPVARTDAQHRLREILLHCAPCSRGRRLTRLARAT